MHLKRPAQQVRALDPLQAARTKEVEAMARILQAYAKEEGGRLPKTLEQLVPEYAPSLGAFADAANREVTYYPGHTALTCDPAMKLKTTPFPRSYNNLPLPDQMMAKEQQLVKAGYGSILYPEVVLKAAYREPDLVLCVITNATGEELLRIEEGDKSLEPLENGEYAREVCSNNLHTLKGIVRRYMREHEGYSPAGWLSLFPDYLPDPSVLRCPLDALGTASYQCLQPATMLSAFSSDLPLVVCKNTHHASKGPSRNVMFISYSVETIPEDSAEWREKILPYLEAQ